MNFKEDLLKLNIELSPKMEEAFKTYYEYLVEYNNFQSVNNIIMILAAISVNGKIINTNPYLLFNNPDKAGDYYLQHKEELDFSFLYKEE